MSTLELERDAIKLIQSYGLSQYAEICTRQTQNIQILGSDRTSLQVISNLLLAAAQQAQKTPRTAANKAV